MAATCPGTTSFAYTRNWRRPDVLNDLVRLAPLPNVSVRSSSGRDSGPTPGTPRVRVAFLLARGEEEVASRRTLILSYGSYFFAYPDIRMPSPGR